MKLRHDPFAAFASSTEPACARAQRQWGLPDPAGLLAQGIAGEQRPDGSWEGSVPRTIERLFALWLLGEARGPAAQSGLDWLLEGGKEPFEHCCADGARYDGLFFRTTRADREGLRAMSGVPFVAGCAGFAKTGAALFLANGCGMRGDPRVERAFGALAEVARVRRGALCSPACSNNLLIALATDGAPDSQEAALLAVPHVAAQADVQGGWRGGFPFYPTLWWLSFVDHGEAARQVHRALPRLVRSQNLDGSWGRRQRELVSYLVLDALERSGALIETRPRPAQRDRGAGAQERIGRAVYAPRAYFGQGERGCAANGIGPAGSRAPRSTVP
ncbi:MAG: hypothetical protein AB1505_08950 [Candidatus Latescibacterota bacterium]